jgi:hypothetical protein
MYLAEFTFPGTTELVSDLLLKTSLEGAAKDFALKYASNWGIELFALTLATEQQERFYQILGKAVLLEPKFSKRMSEKQKLSPEPLPCSPNLGGSEVQVPQNIACGIPERGI